METSGVISLTAVAAVGYASWAEQCVSPLRRHAQRCLTQRGLAIQSSSCASINGSFPYPFLTLNPLPVRIAIYAGASAFAIASFWGLNALKKGMHRQAKGKGKGKTA